MSLFKKSALAVALLVGSVGGASAADPMVSYEQGGFNWSGTYLAAFVGHTFGSSLDVDPRHIAAETGRDIEGLIAGVSAGHRWHLDNDIVVGVDLTLPLWAQEGDLTTTGPGARSYANPIFGYIVGANVGRAYGQFLPYVHAGAGQTWVEGGSPANGTSVTNAHLVATVGAGLAVQITESLNARVQYNYIHAFNEDYSQGWNVVPGWSQDMGWSGNAVFLVLEYELPIDGLFN